MADLNEEISLAEISLCILLSYNTYISEFENPIRQQYLPQVMLDQIVILWREEFSHNA
jgi:hypothetical protein